MNLKIKTLGIFGAALTLVACGGGSSSQFADGGNAATGSSFSTTVISQSSGPETDTDRFNTGLSDGTLMSSATATAPSTEANAVSKVGFVDGQVTGLGASTGDRLVSLTWASFSGANSYLVTKTDGFTGLSETLEVFESKYTDQYVVDGQDYLYEVVAVTSDGISGSAVASVNTVSANKASEISFD